MYPTGGRALHGGRLEDDRQIFDVNPGACNCDPKGRLPIEHLNLNQTVAPHLLALLDSENVLVLLLHRRRSSR